MRYLILIIAVSICLFTSSACDPNSNTGNPVTIDDGRTRIPTTRGNTCPVFEDELFGVNEKAVFDDCDLKRNSKILDGRMLRVRSRYWMTIPHGAVLISSICDQTSSTVEPVSVEFEYEKDQNFILDTLKANPADIEAIGRFTVLEPSRKSDSVSDNVRFHFDLVCLEKASAPDANANR